jgi:hypothetical protein
VMCANFSFSDGRNLLGGQSQGLEVRSERPRRRDWMVFAASAAAVT